MCACVCERERRGGGDINSEKCCCIKTMEGVAVAGMKGGWSVIDDTFFV